MSEHLSDHFRNAIISSHTLRTQDLIKSFMSFLEDELPVNAFHVAKESYELVKRSGYVTRVLEGEWDEPFADMDYNIHYALNDQLELLFEIMNCIAPEGCYFGSSEGDGACFGFWEYEEEE